MLSSCRNDLNQLCMLIELECSQLQASCSPKMVQVDDPQCMYQLHRRMGSLPEGCNESMQQADSFALLMVCGISNILSSSVWTLCVCMQLPLPLALSAKRRLCILVALGRSLLCMCAGEPEHWHWWRWNRWGCNLW